MSFKVVFNLILYLTTLVLYYDNFTIALSNETRVFGILMDNLTFGFI